MVSDDTTRNITRLCVVGVMLLALFSMLFFTGYPDYLQEEANRDACQNSYGPSAEWVAGPNDADQLICATSDGDLGYTRQPPTPPLLDWENFKAYTGAVAAGEA